MTSGKGSLVLARSPGSDDAPAISVQDLRMRYGDRDVLDGITFAVGSGEVLALLGPNGAGKSTTIEILEGFRQRSAGEVSVLGVDPAGAGESWRSDIGIVLQSWRDHGRWRVRDLLRHLGRFYVPFDDRERTRPRDADELIELVGLTEHRDARISTLSGGERRRLDLAIGIIGRPRILFLDEPTAGLDPVARRGFHDLVHDLADLEETTVLLATHDLDEAEKIADRILILDRGAIRAEGSPDQLVRQVAGRAEVRWSRAGERFVHPSSDATGFVRDLFRQYGEGIADLEVRRSSLEETYMAIVAARESGLTLTTIGDFEEATP